MKRMFALVTAVCIALLLAGCQRGERAKQEIFRLVEENYEAIVQACQARDAEALQRIVTDADVKVHEGHVVVYCTGGGIAPSSQDYGFYYARENIPAVVDCNEEILCTGADLTPKGEGYQYIFYGNVFYTECIRGNLYFYSTSY